MIEQNLIEFAKISNQIHDGRLDEVQNSISKVESRSMREILQAKLYFSQLNYQEVVKVLTPLQDSSDITNVLSIMINYLLGYSLLEIERMQEGETLIINTNEKYNNINQIDPVLDIQNDIKVLQQLANINLKWYKGELKSALEDFDEDEIITKNIVDYRLQIKLPVLISTIHRRLGNLDKALAIFENIQSNSGSTSFKELCADIYRGRTIINLIRGNIEAAEHNITKSLEIAEDINYQRGTGESYALLFTIKSIQGTIDEALNSAKKAENIFTTIGLNIPLAKIYNNKANLYQGQGDLEKALEFQQKSLMIKENLGDEMGKSISLLNIGSIYSMKSYYKKAMDYYNKALEIQEKLGLKRNIAETKLNMGVIYREQGDLDIALLYFNEGREINEKMGTKNALARDLQNIASVFSLKSEFEKAYEYYKKSLDMRKEMNNKLEIADVIFQLVIASLDLNDEERALSHLDELSSIVVDINTPKYQQKQDIAEALIYKSRSRLVDKVKAMQLLNKIQLEGILLDQHIIATLHLIDLLLDELGMYGDKKVLEEIYQLFSILQSRAEDQNLNALIVELLIFEAKVHLLNQDIQNAHNNLELAYTKAKNYELTYLIEKITSEKTKLENYLLEMKNLVDKENTLVDRMKRAQVKQYLKKVINSL